MPVWFSKQYKYKHLQVSTAVEALNQAICEEVVRHFDEPLVLVECHFS
jgi:hypothetical protein